MRRRPMAVALAALLLSGCASAQPTLQVVADGDAERGRAAILQYGCTSCHAVPGVSSVANGVGPDLEGFDDRRYIAGQIPNRPEELIRWLLDPQSIEPGTLMPASPGMTEQDARDIAAYLYDQ